MNKRGIEWQDWKKNDSRLLSRWACVCVCESRSHNGEPIESFDAVHQFIIHSIDCRRDSVALC